MKKLLPVVVLLSLSVPLFAAEIEVQNLIAPLGSASQIVIPAAGSVQGANGTFFRSDITLINYASHSQMVRFRWLPQGSSGVSVPARDVTLNALTGMSSEDFVTTILQQSGLGSILITGINADGTPDSTAKLFATSRIWSNQPGLSSGTVSQTFPTIPTAGLNSTSLSLIGLKRDDRYRLNVGVINLDLVNEQTLQIIASGSNATAEVLVVTVPPLSMSQVSLVGSPLSNLQVAVQNTTAAATRTNLWTAYGSSVDNITGDSWSEIGFTAAAQ